MGSGSGAKVCMAGCFSSGSQATVLSLVVLAQIHRPKLIWNLRRTFDCQLFAGEFCGPRGRFRTLVSYVTWESRSCGSTGLSHFLDVVKGR